MTGTVTAFWRELRGAGSSMDSYGVAGLRESWEKLAWGGCALTLIISLTRAGGVFPQLSVPDYLNLNFTAMGESPDLPRPVRPTNIQT